MVYAFAALAGAMVILNMTLNARLARELGTFRGTFVNYLVGLSLTAAVALLSGALSSRGWQMPEPVYLFGGALGVLVVASSNMVIPRIPVVYSAALLFAGQIAAGMAIDWLREGTSDPYTGAGAAIVLAGVLLNATLDAREERRRAPAAGGSAESGD